MSGDSTRSTHGARFARVATLSLIAALVPPGPVTAGGGERELRQRSDLGRRLSAEQVDPGSDANGSLDPSRHAQLPTFLPGVAWTPGGPDGGGGSDDPWEPASDATRYDLEVLPEQADNSCLTAPWDISEDRDWIGGQTGVAGECGGCSGPVLWRRDPIAGWLLNTLPGLTEVDAQDGDVNAVLDGGTAVGSDSVFGAGCAHLRVAPVIWEPIGLGVWDVTELPTPNQSGIAFGAVDSAGLGRLVVGRWWTGSDNKAALWRRVDDSWTFLDLGNLGVDARATAVNRSGVVVGHSREQADEQERPFIIEPLDMDHDGVAETWFQDADGDSVNDLMRVLTELGGTGRAESMNAYGAAVGYTYANPGATYWRRDAAGVPVATLLPAGPFSEGTRASSVNSHAQAIGYGTVTDGNGTEDHGALWEVVQNAWRVSDLNDVTPVTRFELIRRALAINYCGDITGTGYTRDDNDVALVLTPRSGPCE